MINEKINKSFLNITSPPSFLEFGNHPTIKCSINIITNIYYLYNNVVTCKIDKSIITVKKCKKHKQVYI